MDSVPIYATFFHKFFVSRKKKSIFCWLSLAGWFLPIQNSLSMVNGQEPPKSSAAFGIYCISTQFMKFFSIFFFQDDHINVMENGLNNDNSSDSVINLSKHTNQQHHVENIQKRTPVSPLSSSKSPPDRVSHDIQAVPLKENANHNNKYIKVTFISKFKAVPFHLYCVIDSELSVFLWKRAITYHK